MIRNHLSFGDLLTNFQLRLPPNLYHRMNIFKKTQESTQKVMSDFNQICLGIVLGCVEEFF